MKAALSVTVFGMAEWRHQVLFRRFAGVIGEPKRRSAPTGTQLTFANFRSATRGEGKTRPARRPTGRLLNGNREIKSSTETDKRKTLAG